MHADEKITKKNIPIRVYLRSSAANKSAVKSFSKNSLLWHRLAWPDPKSKGRGSKLKAQQDKQPDIFELSAFSFELTRNKNGIIPKSRSKIDFHHPGPTPNGHTTFPPTTRDWHQSRLTL